MPTVNIYTREVHKIQMLSTTGRDVGHTYIQICRHSESYFRLAYSIQSTDAKPQHIDTNEPLLL